MRLALVATGGTIASRATPQGVVADVAGAELLSALGPDGVPAGAEVSVLDVGVRESYALTLDDMRDIALAVVDRCAHGFDGVVVTHGTDSLEETAFLVDLVHKDETPVVFTGAQRAFDEADGDGPQNLALALKVAATQTSRGSGVLVAFGGRVLPARGVRKVETSALTAFENFTHAGHVPGARSTLGGAAEALANVKLPEVEVVAAVPGGTGAALRDAIHRRPAGIVLQALGVGNVAPADAAAVQEAVEVGIPVAVTTRVLRGVVRPIYGNGGGKALERAGAIFAGDLTTWQARVLLAVCLALASDDRAEQTMAAWLARFATG